MSRIIIAICVLALLCGTRPSSLAAAQRVVQASAQVIDGSKNPEKVPDEITWLMLFTTIADGPNTLNYNMRATFLRPAGFTDAEIGGIVAAANEAMARIQTMEQTVLGSASGTDDKTPVLLSQRDAILRDVVTSLLLRLSPDAGEKFRKHIIEKVKPGITITP